MWSGQRRSKSHVVAEEKYLETAPHKLLLVQLPVPVDVKQLEGLCGALRGRVLHPTLSLWGKNVKCIKIRSVYVDN